jgi:CRP/FNR family cyclic AMP-dependent transcriptional regulator
MRIHRKRSHLDQVRRIPGLRGAGARELSEVSSLLDRVQLNPGDVLTREGSWDRTAFIVLDGQADVVIGGRAVRAAGPGEFVGEVAMIDHGPHTATVRATTPMEVFVIGPESFGPLLSYGRVGHALIEQMTARLRAAEGPGALTLVLDLNDSLTSENAFEDAAPCAQRASTASATSTAWMRSAATPVRTAG